MDKKYLLNILRSQGFSEDIMDAFDSVNREDFVPEEHKLLAYYNNPLPIGYGQTISQPTTIAFMLHQLELKDKLNILEIGSGSGYVIALINHLLKNSTITGIERIKELADSSKENFAQNNNIKIINANAFNGYEMNAPYDRILVSAAAKSINQKILDQLSDDGIAVMPIENSIYKITRRGDKFYHIKYLGFVFVPLVE